MPVDKEYIKKLMGLERAVQRHLRVYKHDAPLCSGGSWEERCDNTFNEIMTALRAFDNKEVQK